MSTDTQTCNTPVDTPPEPRPAPRTVTQVIVHHEPADPLREFVHGLAFGAGVTLGVALLVGVGLKVAGVELPALAQ
jgi:hypothetical protein